MKTKSSRLKIRNHRLNCADLCFRCLFYVFCFQLAVLCLTVSFAQAEISSVEDLTSKGARKEVVTSVDSAKQQGNSHLRHQLIQANISLYQGETESKSKNELKKIIEKVRSVVFKPQTQTPEAAIAVEPPATTEPGKTSAKIEIPKESTEIQRETESELQYEPVSDRTLQMVEDFMQEPNRLDNLFELGEVLFLSGRPKEAVVFYQEALNHYDPNDFHLAQEKAWILFQIGNCLRNDNMSTARNAYRKLIVECDSSPWVELAKAREDLIDWYLKNEPRTLIVECERLVNGRLEIEKQN